MDSMEPGFTNLSALKMKAEETRVPEVTMIWARRPTSASSISSHENDLSSASSAGTTSPVTPATNVSLATALANSRDKGELVGLCSDGQPYSGYSRSFGLGQPYWPLPLGTEGVPLSSMSTFDTSIDDPFGPRAEEMYRCAVYQPFSNPMINPPLSRPMFSTEQSAEPLLCSGMSHDWDMQPIFSPQSVIVPGDAFHTILAPSPMIKETQTLPTTVSPPRTILPDTGFQHSLTSTPLGLRTPVTPFEISNETSMLMSSPSFIFSPRVLPSQNRVDEEYHGRSNEDVELSPEGVARVRRATSTRLTRRQYSKKMSRLTGRASRPPLSKSGIDCPVIIPENVFPCKYKDCIDKQTKKQKKFKRQEHKKRHEKTVHEKSMHSQHACWVPECKTPPFSRTDNLKSHLKKTHGRLTAGNRRNRYVATQDEQSEFYNPDWIGPLDKHGYPIFDVDHPRFEGRPDFE